MASPWHPGAPDISSIVQSLIRNILQHDGEALCLEKSFVQLGGHSLAALVLSTALPENGISISVPSILTSASIQDFIQQVEARQTLQLPTSPTSISGDDISNACLESNESNNWQSITLSAELEAEERPSKRFKVKNAATDHAEFTKMQMSLVCGGLRSPGTNVIHFFDSYAPDIIPTMKRAWRLVLGTESLSRLELKGDLDGACTVVPQPLALDWSETYFDSQLEYSAELDKFCLESAVASGFRVLTLYDHGTPKISTIVWQVHHALIDGYSASLIYRKVHRAASGLPISPGTPFAQVAREISRLRREKTIHFQEFWKQKQDQHSAAASEINFRVLSTTVNDRSAMAKSLNIPVSGTQLSTLAREAGVTVATLHYAIWALVLSKFTDSESVLFGALLSGRSLPIRGILDTIGPTINTLPFYAQVDLSMNLSRFLASVSQGMAELESVQTSVPEDGFARSFATAIAVEPAFYLEGTAFKPLKEPYFTTVNDIPLNILIGLKGNAKLVYRTDRFRECDVQLITEYYTTTAALITSLEWSLADIFKNMTPCKVQERLFEIGNAISDSTFDSAVTQDLVTLFESVATHSPDAIALEKGMVQISYTELDQRASTIADHLSHYIENGDIVCVHADRSINYIAVIYAILKVGAAYAPLDPSLPDEARSKYYEIAKARAFIIPDTSSQPACPASCQICVRVGDLFDGTQLIHALPHRLEPRLDDDAYVCFTSGSTGCPKAVLCHHRGLVAFQMDEEVRLFASFGVKVSQIMSPAFDGSIHEIFSALSYGATLVLPSAGTGFDHLAKADSAVLTPSLAKVMSPHDFPRLRRVYLGGEEQCSTSAGYLRTNTNTDTHCRIADQRIYRTGDRGYWDESGDIHYLGRNDRQVKLNGFRLDLNAIEGSIAQVLPEATGVALTIHDGHFLAALQPSSLDALEMKSRLSLALPPYAMPGHLLILHEFPLTPAGKLDYNKLVTDIANEGISTALNSCMTVASKIESLWRHILGLGDNVVLDRHSNFAALGGHSLLQISLASKLSATFKRRIRIKHIVQHPNLGSMISCISTILATPIVPPVSCSGLRTLGRHVLSSTEIEWCRRYKSSDETSSFNISLVYKLEPTMMDTEKLERAFNEVLQRYEVLQSKYIESSTVFSRHYHVIPPRVRRLRRFNVRREINKPFKLGSDQLFRVLLSQSTMLVCASHIICDSTTLKILLREVVSFYNGRSVPPPERLYRDTTVWSNLADSNDLDYWKKTLTGADRIKIHGQNRDSYSGTSRLMKLDRELAISLFEFLSSTTYTAHQVALTAVTLAYQFDAINIDLVLGGPFINRAPEDMTSVGLFLEPLPIRVQYECNSPEDPLHSVLASIQSCSQSALAHAVPFNKILNHLDIQPGYPDHPLFDTMVTFHDDRTTDLLSLPGVSRKMVWSEGAKFELMFEFTAFSEDTVFLRIEYDDDIHDESSITRLESLILEALELVFSNASFADAQKCLGALRRGEKTRRPAEQVPFGAIL